MSDILKNADNNPLFRPAINTAISLLTESARILKEIGVDVTPQLTSVLQAISKQLADAAYEATDLDALLAEAQALGDDVVKTKTKKRQSPETFGKA
jgi:hypothetical protein